MLFLFGGSIYYLLEIIFRGYSFTAMIICGGLCFTICGAINEKNRCMPLVLQQLVAAAGITAIEFLFGLVLNVWLGLRMWDYSNMPGNILGQICPQFTALHDIWCMCGYGEYLRRIRSESPESGKSLREEIEL